MKKTKIDRKNSKSSHVSRSLSNQKTRKTTSPSSFLFNNVKKSVCYMSGKSPKHQIHQKTYMQFIEDCRISKMESRRHSFAFQTRKVKTPTPRRNSLGPSDKKNQYLKAKVTTKQRNNDLMKSQPVKKVSFKNNLFIKGQQLRPSQEKKSKKHFFENIKLQKQSIDKKSKVNLKNNKKTKQNKTLTINRTLDASQKLDTEQQKLLQKLFKGVQFYRTLGKGAHASVKSAVDWNKNRKIAIKVYQKQKVHEQQTKNIQREVQILMSLNHPNIIKLYEIIQSYKTINLIMQYGGGNSLEQFMRSKTEGFLSELEAARIFSQVLQAAQYLESKNIVHRDLKPDNILLNKHLQVKIIDFGFALSCKKQQNISSYCGTPTFMAPQVVTKKPHNPHLADRWSLGILLYTMLNGCCPFKASTQQILFQKIKGGNYSFFNNLSTPVRSLIQQFLIQNPQERISAKQALSSKWIKQYKQSGL